METLFPESKGVEFTRPTRPVVHVQDDPFAHDRTLSSNYAPTQLFKLDSTLRTATSPVDQSRGTGPPLRRPRAGGEVRYNDDRNLPCTYICNGQLRKRGPTSREPQVSSDRSPTVTKDHEPVGVNRDHGPE